MNRYALIGYPLGHSLSPIMHNSAFRELGLEKDHKYELRPTLDDELYGIVAEIREGSLSGANVTIPYKKRIIEYLDIISEESTVIGSVNTLHRKGELVEGCNTDASGFLRSLNEQSVQVKHSNAIIIGAGGAARAVAYTLVREGINRIDIMNRSAENVNNMVDELRLSEWCEIRVWSRQLKKPDMSDSNLLVNCTPIGMTGYAISDMPMKGEELHSDLVVVDLVYNPRETKLLREAKKRGCKIIDGTGMLVHQGAAAFELWIGKKPPIETMRSTVIQALGG